VIAPGAVTPAKFFIDFPHPHTYPVEAIQQVVQHSAKVVVLCVTIECSATPVERKTSYAMLTVSGGKQSRA
jgi:hypothetical protein